MGRGRVELKRIENKINREVTFAKRRNGLLKKAFELSVLCDAEVALIIISNRGKIYEFSTSNMLKILERYQNYTDGSVEADEPSTDAEKNSHMEYEKLKAKYESLQQYQRQVLGEDLELLSLKELEQLEQQLESTLRKIESVKTHSMVDQLSELQIKERMRLNANKDLKNQMEEVYAENVAGPSRAAGENYCPYEQQDQRPQLQFA